MSISFELTKDPALLEQYYRIREECFRRELGIRSFDGGEDDFDRCGEILVIRDGLECIGGARLSGSSPVNPGLLPLEVHGFLILRAFPQIAQRGQSYCQWTRLALLPRYRATENLRDLGLSLIREAKQAGYSYSFNVAGMNRARLYQRLHKSLGYDYEICRELKIPAEKGFMGLEHLLSIGYLEQGVRLGQTTPCLPGSSRAARIASMLDVA